MKKFNLSNSLFLLGLLLVPSLTFAQLFCNTGQFYAIGNGANSVPSAIYRLQNSGGTITIPNLLTPIAALPNTNQMSLAIADFGDGKKLYSHYKLGAVNRILRLDGATWNVAYSDSSANYTITNAAGNGSFLYFHASRTNLWPGLINRFVGNAMVTIWEDSVTSLPVGDIAVDNSGNVFFFSGIGSMVNRLNIIAPTGVILDTLPVSFNASFAYGCFFDDDVLYVGFGANSVTYPNKLIPFYISPGQVVMGSPLNMPNPVLGSTPNGTIRLNFNDLASCSNANINFQGGGSTSTNDLVNEINWQLFPVPATQEVTVKWDNNQSTDIRIFDMYGKVISTYFNRQEEIVIPIAGLSSGIYWAEIRVGNKVARRKWIKQ